MSGLRISATTLESFRLFSEGDWMEESDLIDTILGKFRPTIEIQIGQAYHSILETPDKYRAKNGYTCRGTFFAPEVVAPMLEKIDRQGLFEVRATLDVLGNTLVCKVDHIYGVKIKEFKTTFKPFDADKYLQSLQWRVMALAFGAASVTYEVACFQDFDTVELRTIESLTVYPYGGMRSDIESWVRKFEHYCTQKGLDEHLRQKQSAAETRAGINDKQLAFDL
jgi:hypothetical protein